MFQAPQQLTPITKGGSILKRVVIGVIVVFVIVIVFAELGIVRLESTSAHWSTDQKSEWNATNIDASRRGAFYSHFRMIPEVAVGGVSGSGKAIADEAAKAIRKSTKGSAGADGAKLTITIKQVATKGAAWLPMYRDASCTFAASYQFDAAAGSSSMQVRGEIKGKVQQTMKGFSSLSLFQQMMGQAIANAILNDIRKGAGVNAS